MIAFSMAGLTILLENQYPHGPKYVDFPPLGAPDLTIRVSEAEIQAEQPELELTPGYREHVCAYRAIAEQLPDFDAFVMHGAAVVKDDAAYLFTAPSGTGKTTHLRLWRSVYPDSWILNGDKPTIRRFDGVFYACGTPWRGKERYGNAEMRPLAGICILSRGKENHIERVDSSAALVRLMRQVYICRDSQRLGKELALLDACFRSVPVYEMQCNMEPEAARVAYEAMRNAPAARPTDQNAQ
ncbi:MAG: hypothetical protein II581_06285 [Oscillospiraceae bacterium]|nr:hypothetical protein [Oscillospiraceae bacterium]